MRCAPEWRNLSYTSSFMPPTSSSTNTTGRNDGIDNTAILNNSHDTEKMKSQKSIINIYTYGKHITLYTPFNLVASGKRCMLEMELCRIITFTKICFFSSHTLHYIQYKTFRFLLDTVKRETLYHGPQTTENTDGYF